jgi:hypothetical protein
MMPTVHFLGKVFPEALQMSVDHTPIIKWEEAEIGLTMEFSCHIVKSRIDVECKLNRFTVEDFVPIYMRALDLCRASVDVVAFAKGWGLTVYLDTFVDPNGMESVIVFKDDRLPPLCTALTLTEGFDKIHNLVLGEPALFMALNDLIVAITLPHVAPVNCARAMERLRHLIASPGSSDKNAWQQMRAALQIDERYLRFITKHSADARHGRPVRIPGAVTNEVIRRGWIIMNRYFEYRKREQSSLPENDFPLLVDR